MVTVCRISAAPFAALCVGISAVELFSVLDQSCGTGTTTTTASAHAPSLESAIQVLLPLVATAALVTAVACIYRNLHRAGGSGGNRRLSELVTFTLDASAGVLVFCLFVQPGDAVAGDALIRALGTAAAAVLPAAATVTFFLGVALVFAAHIRVGGEGGGTVVAGDGGPVQAPVRLLTKTALGAAAALVGLLAVALYTNVQFGQGSA